MKSETAVVGAVLLLAAVAIAGEPLQGAPKQTRPKPEVMVAPAVPYLALGVVLGEQIVTVSINVDAEGRVTRALAVGGPCLYTLLPPTRTPVDCDPAREAETHKRLSEKYRNESLDQSLSDAERTQKYKEFNTELWLSAQFQMYAAAEQAARQWLFLPLRPGPAGEHVLHLTFKFSRGDAASIQVLDPWTISVVGALYPR